MVGRTWRAVLIPGYFEPCNSPSLTDLNSAHLAAAGLSAGAEAVPGSPVSSSCPHWQRLPGCTLSGSGRTLVKHSRRGSGRRVCFLWWSYPSLPSSSQVSDTLGHFCLTGMLFGYFTDGQRGSKASDPNRTPSRCMRGAVSCSYRGPAALPGERCSRGRRSAGNGPCSLVVTAFVSGSSSISCQGATKQAKHLLFRAAHTLLL